MTREEAISVLKETIDPNIDKSFKEWKEWDKEKHLPAVNMAIDALRVEPVVRCIDCIFWYDCEYTFKSENGFCCCGEREEE